MFIDIFGKVINVNHIVTYYYKLDYNNGKRIIFIITTNSVIKGVVENIDTVNKILDKLNSITKPINLDNIN